VRTFVSELLTLFAAVFVGWPLLTIVHELAHGIVARLLIGGRVVVVQGPGRPRLRLVVRGLDVRLQGLVLPQRAFVGWARWGAHRDTWRHIAATAAGPVASAACVLLALASAVRFGGDARLFLDVVVPAAVLQTASTSLPVRYGRAFGTYAGQASDALRIRRLLEGEPESLPAPIAALLTPVDVDASGRSA
jgi:hypothetical protein